jgi:hypothetical protein
MSLKVIKMNPTKILILMLAITLGASALPS